MKAVALFSGGLDSILAVKMMEEQGVEVLPLHMVTPFTGRKNPGFLTEMLELYGVKIHRVVELITEFIPLLTGPPHGFGRHMNPCIDCKILFLKKTKEIMEEVGASFVITGEVVGQRPMSQRAATLHLIEKEAGLEGLILRPLSAQLLPPTIPELKGWINRCKLEAISGRGRKRQMELAKRYGWRKMPSPAGGCLLTDPAFSKKLKDLLEHLAPGMAPNIRDLELLRVGRHLRLSTQTKLVVGRSEGENATLQSLATSRDVLLRPEGIPGPIGLLIGEVGKRKMEMAASIMARYCRGVKPITFICTGHLNGKLKAHPLPPEEVDRWLIT